MIQIIPVQSRTSAHPVHDRDNAPIIDRGNVKGGGCIINAGNEHVCVLSFDDGLAGIEDAGLRIAAAAAGSGILMPESEDGVVRMRAAHGGLLRIEKSVLRAIHSLGGIRINVLAVEQLVVKNQLIAEMWLEPAPAGEGALNRIEEFCRRCRPVIDVQPFNRSRVGILTAPCPGSPRRLKETVAAVQGRCIELGCEIVFEIALQGGLKADLEVIGRFIDSGTDMLIGIGFPEVDASFIAEIKKAGGELTMVDRSLAGKLVWRDQNDAVPVLWLSSSVMDNRRLIADMVVPRFLTGLNDCRMQDGDAGRIENVLPACSGVRPADGRE